MKHIYNNETIWAEKYRPKYLEDVIFPEELKTKLKEELDNGIVSNTAYFGKPGNGKCLDFDEEVEIFIKDENLYNKILEKLKCIK